MEKAYKDGNVWVINQYRLGANTCIGVESADGLRFDIKLLTTMEVIAKGLYTEYEDNSETPVAYTKETLTAFFQDFFFRVGGSGVSSDGYLYLPTTLSTNGIRIGERTGWVYAVDKVLTETGFTGDEGTDWENVGGQEIV